MLDTVMGQVLLIAALTLLPFLELRASIPYGIFKTDLHWSVVFVVCVFANMLLGPLIFAIIDKVVHVATKIRFIAKIWHKYVEKLQKRIKPYVQKYGEPGIALFIGVPLPGSGSYSGAIGSYILGLKWRDFLFANTLGVLIAGTAVLLICLFGDGAMSIFIKAL